MALDIAPNIKPSRTAKYTLYDLGRDGVADPVLEVRDSCSDRAPYRVAARKAARSIRAMTEAEQTRALAKLIAKHLIVGWENVTEGGIAVSYSAERGEELLGHIIDAGLWEHYIHPLQMFVAEPANFRDSLPEATDLGNG